MQKKSSQKTLAREEKIKAVALELFLTKGYEATHLKDIIKISGGSFSNIYQSFTDKENLFLALIKDLCSAHFEQITKAVENIEYKSLEEFLTSFAKAYLSVFFTPDNIAAVRLIFSQIDNKKLGLSSWFADNQERLSESIVVEFLRKQKEESISKNALELANTFCAMLREPYFRDAICHHKIISSKEQSEHVDFVVKIFLHGLVSFH